MCVDVYTQVQSIIKNNNLTNTKTYIYEAHSQKESTLSAAAGCEFAYEGRTDRRAYGRMAS